MNIEYVFIKHTNTVQPTIDATKRKKKTSRKKNIPGNIEVEPLTVFKSGMRKNPHVGIFG